MKTDLLFIGTTLMSLMAEPAELYILYSCRMQARLGSLSRLQFTLFIQNLLHEIRCASHSWSLEIR